MNNATEQPRADERALRLRLKRQGMAVASYMMFLAPLSYSVHNGWMEFSWLGLGLLSALALLVNAVFIWLVASGRSARFSDPSMTLAQVVMAMGLALVMIRYANEARSVFLMLFFASFFFGIFGLRKHEFWMVAGATIVAYGAVVGLEFRGYPAGSERVRLETLQFITLIVILLWMAAIGSYVARLRQRLAEQKSALHDAVGRLHEMATRDELTGLPNRRYLMDVIEHERARCQRAGALFSICLLDVDRFKSINDRLGHSGGDEVLVEFGRRIVAQGRKMDWVGRVDRNGEVSVGRYGGEEFMVLMPGATAEQAREAVERMRKSIGASPFETMAGQVDVDFSAGVAQCRPGESVDEMINRADKALYRAKDSGRGRTLQAA